MANKKAVEKKKNPWRPAYYETAEELQAKIDEFFRNPPDTRSIYTKDGNEIVVPVITITGLVLFLGFADRRSFYDYEKNPVFSHTIKRARTFIEKEYETQLAQNPTGAIFALKNFGWTDKTETTIKVGNVDKVNNLLNEIAESDPENS